MKSLEEFMQPSPISAEVMKQFSKGIVEKTVKKGTILQSAGDQSHPGFFVKKGLLRCYTIDAKGKEHVFMFAPEGWMAGDIESQTYNKPAVLYIDALEDSVIDVLNNTQSFDQIGEFPKDALVFQLKKMTRRISTLQHRVLLLISATAAERYEEFVKTYPGIVQRVPQKMIASYLGITPEALSKIRGNIAKK